MDNKNPINCHRGYKNASTVPFALNLFEEHFDGADIPETKYAGLGIEQLVFLEIVNGHVRCGEWKDSTHHRRKQ